MFKDLKIIFSKDALAQYRFVRNIVPSHGQWAIHPVLDVMTIGVDRDQMIQPGVLFSLPQELLDHVVVPQPTSDTGGNKNHQVMLKIPGFGACPIQPCQDLHGFHMIPLRPGHRRELPSIPSLPRAEGEGLAEPAFCEICHVRIRAGVPRLFLRGYT